MKRFMLLGMLSVSVLACGPDERGARDGGDPHSWARPDEVAVTHLDLDVTVSFERRRIHGEATLHIDNLAGADELWLDTRDLDISRVRLHPAVDEVVWSRGDVQPFLGRPMRVEIRPETTQVKIEYSSRPEAAALQWLGPAQTAGGRHPFLLSQSQSVLARTWIPCQDTPAVRMTYNATVRVPPDLMALMSAENPTRKNDQGVYEFEMLQPIPSYLLAIAVGDLEYRSLGDHSGVYAEPEVIERAVYEFADTERMIDVAAELYGPYRWGVYDMIVLPPSFPYGGMENPRLSFMTPTLLAGDRSLVSTVAHELAHSWSGNLVTNATWNDFWLNEGFTTYFEYRIMEQLYGRDYSEMLAFLARRELLETFDDLGPGSSDGHLWIDLAGRDPDDTTDVAYEKGYAFLRLLEERYGRERWDRFLRDYFERFAFQSMTTDRFLEYLRKELIVDGGVPDEQLQIEAWIFGPGLPDNAPVIESGAFAAVEAWLEQWMAGTPAPELPGGVWSTHEWLHFLRSIPRTVDVAKLAELDAAWALSASGNAEILHAWLMKAIVHDYESAYPALEEFLTGVGRRKFLRPLYEELARSTEGMVRARAIYEKARDGYHPVASATVDEILGWPFGS